MACIVNMGTVYHEILTIIDQRQLDKNAASWLTKRLIAEIARRADWQEPALAAPADDWKWADDRMDAVRSAVDQHIAKGIANNESLQAFQPGKATEEVRNVVDWLASRSTDDLLRKLSRVTWAQAVGHSRRWHERLAKQDADAVTATKLADGTEAVDAAPMSDGWHWVRLVTEQALDQEGQAMGHCVGSGGYDSLLDAPAPDGIYSLRDSRGHPHVTVEVRDGCIEQAQGKGNTASTGHADKLAALVLTLDVGISTVQPGIFGLAMVDGRRMSLAQAMELLAAGPVSGDVDLSGNMLTTLPDGMMVDGNLYLNGCTSLTHLPDGLKVGWYLCMTNCTSLTHLTDGLAVDGPLNLNGCASLTALPDGLKVGGYLDLRGCTSLTHLPDGLKVGRNNIHGAEHLQPQAARMRMTG